MSASLYESVAQIARHCWRGVHWEKGPNGPRPVREPLKRHHLERHISGGPGTGLAPIAPGESTTRVAVLDFDSHKGEVNWDGMRKHALGPMRSLEARGLRPIPFRSSGGRGIHLIMLWSDPQDAYSVRELLRAVLEENGLHPGTKGVKAGEVEIFPKQDEVPADGLGNMFVLPGCAESVPLDRATLKVAAWEEFYGAAWPASESVPLVGRPAKVEHDVGSAPSADLAEIREALVTIPNEGAKSLSYDDWRDVIFAIHHATNGSDEGLALAHEFSRRSEKYDPDFLNERVWPYVRSERGGKVITEASLFHRARQHGWQENVLDEFEALPPEEPADAPECEEQPAAASPAPSGRFRRMAVDEFTSLPAPAWHIRDILPEAELALIIGESTAGKSFLALDMVGATACQPDWRGHDAKRRKVVYVVAEGAKGFQARVKAYEARCDAEALARFRENFSVIPAAPNLMQKDDVRDLIADVKAGGPVDIIVIDTFAQATPGANENSGEDMSRALGHCRAIHRATGALVVLVHHVGKDASKGARGWSGLKAAADTEISVTRSGESRLAEISKQKDGSDGLQMPFRLQVVEVGKDDRGAPVTSCVVDHMQVTATGRARREPAGDRQKIVWGVANELAEVGDGETTVAAVVDAAVERTPFDPNSGKRDQRERHIYRALQSLVAHGWLRTENGRVILCK